MFKQIRDYVENILTRGVHSRALEESVRSGLPGGADGPADAYRHILRAAEMTRQGIANTHTILGLREWASSTNSRMDTHNNEIGFAIGEHVKKEGGSWEDVKALCQKAITLTLAGKRPDAIQAENGFVLHEAGYLMREGTLKIADGLEISSPALFPSTVWYNKHASFAWPGNTRDSGGSVHVESTNNMNNKENDIIVPAVLNVNKTIKGR